MNTQVLLFLGKAALLTFVFMLMYRLLLRRETFHGLKRGALMLSLVLSYVLPMTVITVHRDVRKSPVAQSITASQLIAAPINQIQPISPVAETSAINPDVTGTESAAFQTPVQKDKTPDTCSEGQNRCAAPDSAGCISGRSHCYAPAQGTLHP